MALKIRCPHCMRVLVVANEAAGQTKNCPACAAAFTVPLPRAATAEQSEAAGSGLPRCPRCQAEVTVAARHCHRCHTDLATGKRLPLRQRLALVPGWTWGVGAAVIVVLALLTAIGLQIARNRGGGPVGTPRAAEPAGPRIDHAAPAAALLGARSAAERSAALAQFRGIELPAAPALAAALSAGVSSGVPAAEAERNQIAALEILGRQAEEQPERAAEWVAIVRGLGGTDAAHGRDDAGPASGSGGAGAVRGVNGGAALRATALRTRGLLGDETALEELASQWLAELRRVLLLREVMRAAGLRDNAGATVALDEAAQSLARSAHALRALAQRDQPVFPRLAAAYWESWAWLGQERGERLADEVFALARPALGTLEFKPEDVRGPRDVLRRVATSGDPAARAAAGLILQQCGPQYQTVIRQIADGLAELLPTVGGLEQQRLTWALGRLRGRMFGPAKRADPREVDAEEIAAALAWAQPGHPPAPQPPYVAPPVLSVRAVTERGRLEQALLAQMQGGWAPAREALARWRAARLGCTAGVRALLDPGQRAPNPSAVAAALVLVAEAGEQGLRRELELWQLADEQPAWLRALAFTTMGSLDARRGDWKSGWPRGLELGDPRELEQAGPGWEPFGAVLRAGGLPMLARWKDVRPAAISREIETKLLAAARADEDAAAGDARR